MSMLPKDLEEMLGTKEEFENSRECSEVDKAKKEAGIELDKSGYPNLKVLVSNCCGANVVCLDNNMVEGICSECHEHCSIEDDDMMEENNKQDLFESMAMDAMEDLGLTEDEAERELEDFNN